MNIEKATVNIILEVNGKIYLVAMKADRFEAISTLAKMSTENIIETGRTQNELLDFLNFKEAKTIVQ